MSSWLPRSTTNVVSPARLSATAFWRHLKPENGVAGDGLCQEVEPDTPEGVVKNLADGRDSYALSASQGAPRSR